MFISAVDEVLQTFLRGRVPLPVEVAVSFDAPTPEWVAALSGPTVNLFLYRIDKTDHLARAPQRRFEANSRPDRRTTPAPMVDLGYAVSVWAVDAETEHRLLSRMVSLFAATPTVSGAEGGVAVCLGSNEKAPTVPFALSVPLKVFAVVTATAAADSEPLGNPLAGATIGGVSLG